MHLMPTAVPMSDVKNKPGDVLALVEKGPVLLTTRGTGVAVIASLYEWNTMVNHLQERKFSQVEVAAIIEAYRKDAAGSPTISGEELKAQMMERYGHVANKL